MSLVVQADAGRGEEAVLVALQDAAGAVGAVVRPRRRVQLADAAVLPPCTGNTLHFMIPLHKINDSY